VTITSFVLLVGFPLPITVRSVASAASSLTRRRHVEDFVDGAGLLDHPPPRVLEPDARLPADLVARVRADADLALAEDALLVLAETGPMSSSQYGHANASSATIADVTSSCEAS
jgi:hypothetical protein